MDSDWDTPKGGFPHSDISGSKAAPASPELFAGCHVLHRLSTPRHPPDALVILDPSCTVASQVGCTRRRRTEGCPRSRADARSMNNRRLLLSARSHRHQHRQSRRRSQTRRPATKTVIAVPVFLWNVWDQITNLFTMSNSAPPQPGAASGPPRAREAAKSICLVTP